MSAKLESPMQMESEEEFKTIENRFQSTVLTRDVMVCT